MSRFYFPPEAFQDNYIEISGDELHHIRDVMRLEVDDEIIAFDGTGKEYHGRIESIDQGRARIKVEKVLKRKKTAQFTLVAAVGIPKKEKMDLIVQKLTELGVERIIPVMTSRTVVRIKGDKIKKKLERWTKITIEAAKQSGRNTLPVIEEVVSFNNLLPQLKKYDQIFLPCLWGKREALLSAIDGSKKNNLFMIGPEGGFTAQEIEQAVSEGAKLVTLGENTLRTDTAAIAIGAILNAYFQH